MSFQAENDADLVAMTLHYLGPYKWTNLASALQEHVLANEIMQRDKISFDSGDAIDFNVMVNPQGSFRWVAIGEPDKWTYNSLMVKGSIPWKGFNANFAIPSESIAMNREPARIVDLVELQRAGVYTSIAEGIETGGWNMPSGTADDKTPYGIPYWLVPNTVQGFNGGNPFGFPNGAAGISSVTYPQWANYTDSYTEVSKLDAILKMRRAAYFTKFKAPVGVTEHTYRVGDRRCVYTTTFVILEFSSRAQEQNDNLGDDIASKDGTAVFHRNEIIRVPKLDTLSGTGMSGTPLKFSNSTYAASGGYAVNPIMMVNMGDFRPVILKGWWMKQTGPKELWGVQHTVIGTQYDSRMNFIMRNRRESAILTQ